MPRFLGNPMTTLRCLAVLAVLLVPALTQLPPARASSWGGWQSVPATKTYQSPAVTFYHGQLQLFAVGTDCGVYMNSYS
jgi:hypothetical protein